MRVAIGAILGVRGGPARYARELIRALAETPGSHELTVVCDQAAMLDGVGQAVKEVIEIPLRRPWEQGLWEERAAIALRKKRVDLYHGTKGTLPLCRRVPKVVTVHDLAVFHQPKSFAWLQRLHQKTLVPLSVRIARRVITVSTHAREDLCETLGVSATKVVVVPLAAGEVFRPDASERDKLILQSLGVPSPYVLYAGTLQPRKHVEVLVEAYSRLNLGGVHLLLVGRRRPGYMPEFLQQLPAGVRYLGEVPDDVLAALYRNALAFCSPSGYEGFGLSFLEAMACGCPVIAPRHTSIPEVLGPAALYLPRLDAEAIAEALQQVLSDPSVRAQLRKLGLEQAKRFSWSDTARRTLTVYHEALDA
ncbi:Phosphatidyl-myo-inositol mannosyltransferase [bacterium HR30]|nr:Phosphatidyl-myo-inositol mannosyltransferase [bacterium HR30]